MDYKNELGNWEEIILEPSGDTLPIGAITQFSGSIAPTNWLFCNGQAISRTEYSELFAIIGTHYGEGDGSTTFNLPDFIGRVPVGLDVEDPDFDALGDFGGEKTHTLTIDEMPNHNHVLKFKTSGSQPLEGNHGAYLLAGTSDTAIDSTGGNQPHNILQPYLVTNFIIKAKQSVGIVGTVTNDIDDPNANAVPNARTVKASINELVENNQWKYFNKVTGDNTLTLPEAFNELFIAVKRTGTSRTIYLAQTTIPYILLEDDTVEINVGGRLTLSNQGTGAIGQISKTTYQTSACYLSTSAITDYETLIYYR